MISRRHLLVSGLSLGFFGSTMGRLCLATTPEPGPLLVMIILRGGADGLAIVPAHGDRHFSSQRRELQANISRHLTGIYGLHYSMPYCHELYRQQDFSVIHAVGGPHSARSHFDAQQVLESGGSRPYEFADGWLNRALDDIDGGACSLSRNLPLLLRGEAPTITWESKVISSPPQTLFSRLQKMYQQDPLLKARLEAAMQMPKPKQRGRSKFTAAVEYLASGLANLAVIELNGWDTHSDQDQQLDRLLTRLDNGMKELHTGLGEHWKRTAVVVASEFGRTVRPNGTKGTDHGTGGVMLLAGGAVNGGKVVSDWPGLHTLSLLDGRDLRPTLDMRSVFKGVLMDHLGVDEALLESRVFPGSTTAPKMESLIMT